MRDKYKSVRDKYKSVQQSGMLGKKAYWLITVKTLA